MSLTQKTDRRRELNHKRAGKVQRRRRALAGTPPFPIQPEGYDPKAADAKPAKPLAE